MLGPFCLQQPFQKAFAGHMKAGAFRAGWDTSSQGDSLGEPNVIGRTAGFKAESANGANGLKVLTRGGCVNGLKGLSGPHGFRDSGVVGLRDVGFKA